MSDGIFDARFHFAAGVVLKSTFDVRIFRAVPADNEPGFLEEMLRMCKEKEIRLLVPTRDE